MDDTATQLAALQAQLAALQRPAAAQPQAQTFGGFAPAAPTPVQIVGVSVPIKYQTPMGSVRILLTLPADAAASPAALDGALQSIMALGFQLDAWTPKDQGGGWGGNRGGSNYGGNNSGGWRR